MLCHVNNLFLVSQPYVHSNYKEIPAIYWMTLVSFEDKSLMVLFTPAPGHCLPFTFGLNSIYVTKKTILILIVFSGCNTKDRTLV